MPSTSPRPSLTISFRRAEVAAFWTLSTLALAALLAVVALDAGARAPWLWAAAAASIVVPGIVWPAWFIFGIRAWNKGAHLCSVALRGYVLRVCYYAFFSGISPTGSSLGLTLDRAETSRWVRHAGAGVPAGSASSTSGEPWAGGLLAASRRSGSRWMLGLLPMVLLLRILGDQDVASAPASSTYTLY